MQERFRMFRRSGGNFYSRDKITGRSESLGTSDRTQAKQLLAARNQAAAQPQLNRTMAKAYLSAKSPDLLTRTWADVMEHYAASSSAHDDYLVADWMTKRMRSATTATTMTMMTPRMRDAPTALIVTPKPWRWRVLLLLH